jgi:hypothetical protein
MDDWKLPWDGGCRCAAVRIRVTKPPLLTGACHCAGCQTMSASAYSLTVTVPADGFEVTRGEPVLGGLKGPVSHHYHCPDCMSWMFTRAEGFDWFVNLRPSMLDDHGRFEPYAEFWTREKLPWATTPSKHSFETIPEMSVFEDLTKGFAAEGARPWMCP